MSEVFLKVTLPDAERTIVLSQGERNFTLAEILRRENLPLNTRCGQKSLCDGCMVELHEGTLIKRDGETVSSNGQPTVIRGCEYRVKDAARIAVPSRSMLRYAPQVVTQFRINVPVGREPLVRDARPGDLAGAIDIGTTTVVVMLVDMAEGKIVSSAASFNRQMHLGDDVLTRINLCSTDPSMLETLRKSVVVETIAPLLREAAGKIDQPVDQIKVVSVAGNTTMLHLFAGVDPSPMGVSPFTPRFLEHRILDGKCLDMPGFAPPVHLLPGCAAYVGADLSAGIFATGLLYDDGPNLLVDIGTNGEIILKHDGKLYGCATAAGPAFEGAGLESGLRAGDGAISHIKMMCDPFSLELEVIGNTQPSGVCGSAYIDFLAEGRNSGILGETGRIDRAKLGDAEDRVGPWQEHGLALRLAYAAGRRPIVISERDVSKLMQAKAAIAAGILTLLDRGGLAPEDVKKLYLAGGFGMHISAPNAIRCGLLPGFRQDQIEVTGNTSLAGAYLTLLDGSVIEELEHIRKNVEVVELNLDPGFEMRYIDQLSMP